MVLLLGSHAFALTWPEALAAADKNSDTINSARKQADATYWSYLRAYTTYLPQVSANMSMAQTEVSSFGANVNTYSYGITATENIFTGFSRHFGLQTAYAAYQIDQENLRKAESDSYLNVRNAFTNLLIAQENLNLQQKIYARRLQNDRISSSATTAAAKIKGT